MIARETKPAHQKILISLLLTTSEKSTQQGFIAELYLFFIRYLFLFEQSSNKNKSCAVKSSQFPTPQGNIYMGARYLDPKYSRWISTDPALGEYIPAAGKGNSENAVNLPGMGGIFNSVNLSLFHYAGNNPVRYIDPDGKSLHLYISKSRGTLCYVYTTTNNANYTTLMDTIDVITNVNRDSPDNNMASDTNRFQGNDTNPTQVKNGTYKITAARAPSKIVNPDGKYGTGNQGLALDVVQELPKARGDEKGELVADSGYMIHITPYNYTNGCIGLYYDENDKESRAAAEGKMDFLVDLFNETMSENGDKDATITFYD